MQNVKLANDSQHMHVHAKGHSNTNCHNAGDSQQTLVALLEELLVSERRERMAVERENAVLLRASRAQSAAAVQQEAAALLQQSFERAAAQAVRS